MVVAHTYSVALQRNLGAEAHNILRSVHTHLQEFEALRSYAAVPHWVHRAGQLTSALKAVAEQARTVANQTSQEADRLRAARMSRFFLVRLFISRRPELVKLIEAQRATLVSQNLDDALDKL